METAVAGQTRSWLEAQRHVTLCARAMISICICTYNRSESLRCTLDSLARQSDINLDTVEVLVVDNNCTDGTVNVVEAFRGGLPIRRVTESQQGLAHARNRAAADFRGDVLLFTDDDVRLGPGWLAAYQGAFRRFPDADYFGGRILPDWGEAKPRWIGEEPLPLIDGVLVWFDHGLETRPFRPTESLPFGASFAVKRTLLERVGLFRVDLGTGGSGLGRGEGNGVSDANAKIPARKAFMWGSTLFSQRMIHSASEFVNFIITGR